MGLTKFLRTRKPYGDSPPSWWPAKPGPSTSARAKDNYGRSGSGSTVEIGDAGGGKKNPKKRRSRGGASGGIATDTEEEVDDSVDVLSEDTLTDEGNDRSGTDSGTARRTGKGKGIDASTPSHNPPDPQEMQGTVSTQSTQSTHSAQGTKGGEGMQGVYTPPAAPYRADHVCVDMNQILHGSFRTSSDPRHCIAKIFVGEYVPLL